MSQEQVFFRQVMGLFPTGVAVVTTNDRGTLAGLTVNAFCSVSLEPLLILVCIDLSSSVLPHLRASGAFAVNLLTDRQKDLSRGFSTHSRDRYEAFCHASYHFVATGSPVLDDTLAFLDAHVVTEYAGGDHAIFLGQVRAGGAGGQVAFIGSESVSAEATSQVHSSASDLSPLVYFCGAYHQLALTSQGPASVTFQVASPLVNAGKSE